MFQVQTSQCETCIYRKGSPLNLARLEREAAKRDSYRVCHHSTDVCCRGFWDRHANDFNLGRIAQRLGAVQFVSVDSLAPSSPGART
jgi:hypothetical protein